MSDIILSLCLSGRNDDYGHDFKRRFTQAMEFLAWSASRADLLDQIEVVFTDWNSQIPLSREIYLTPAARKLVRFLEVPPEQAQTLNTSISPFQQSLSVNAAFRRARGEFIGVMPSDILMTQFTLRNLLWLLRGQAPVQFSLQQAILAIPRHNIPFFAREGKYFLHPDNIEKLLLAGDSYMQCDNHSRGLMGGYGSFILHHQLLHQLRGLDERIAGWGYNDIDIALRGSNLAPVINTAGYGVKCYDFEPSLLMAGQKEQRRAPVLAIQLGCGENTVAWGLGEHHLVESSAAAPQPFEFPETPPRPDDLRFRDWLIWQSQRVSAFAIPTFSVTALAAGCLAEQQYPRKILLYGTLDRSITAVLSLVCPLAELTVVEQFLGDESFYRIWHDDAILGALRWQGQVHYSPALDFASTASSDLIIVASLQPQIDWVLRNASPQTTLLFSEKSIRGYNRQELSAALSPRFHSSQAGAHAYTPNQLNPAEVKQQWQPFSGNTATVILMLGRRHFSKIQKLGNILLRLPWQQWNHARKLIRRLLASH